MSTPAPNPDILKKLTRARAAMLIDQPFFGSLALRLRLRVMPLEMAALFVNQGLVPTLAVDGVNVWYSERYIENLPDPLVVSAIAHEVGHCVFDHTTRRQHRDPRLWNMAGDYVINDMLKDAGMELKEGWLYEPAFKGLTTDRIYEILKQQGGGGGGGDKGGGDPQDQVLDGEAGDASEMENDWKVATLQSAAAAQREGKLPASLKRFIDEMVEPKNDWRERLRRFITERSREHFNWLRPNRRFLPYELYLPSRFSETMNCLVVVTDDSGSITQDILNVFASETIAARDAARPLKTIVISCDARVNHVAEFDPDDEVKIENHGGGGTDFRPPFKWLEARGIRPSCLIYLTDMYGSFPTAAPEYPVLWCATTDVKAPWGETIRIEI